MKIHWNLNEVKTITKLDEKSKQVTSTGSEVNKIMSTIELTFKSDSDTKSEASGEEQRKLIWMCDNQQERNEFLDTLWKLSEQFVKEKERPKFINYTFESMP